MENNQEKPIENFVNNIMHISKIPSPEESKAIIFNFIAELFQNMGDDNEQDD